MALRLGFTAQDTTLHRLHPLLKLISLILCTTGVLVYDEWLLALSVLLVVLMCMRLARLSLGTVARRLRLIVLFSTMILAVQLLVTSNGTIVLFLVPKLGSFGPFIPVTDYGLARGVTISLRFLVIVLSSMLFVSVTDPTLLAHSLSRLGIPYRYGFLIVIALRFLPLFDQETQTVRMAQSSRGISIEVGRPSKTLRTLRYTFFPLLVSTLSRVETLSESMVGRGFGYSQTRTYVRTVRWRRFDSIVMASVLIAFILCLLIASGLVPSFLPF
ncbi:MAG: energy-coupling factor transporter transmembrane protein EcfT [Candidatus Thorarchaeota archaeon]|nr:energy-coupling factor transporter transmembrane protein EcfT [Candidatus Thorarchaeota archaeon]